RLEGSRWVWATAGAYLVLIFLACLYPRVSDPDYAWKTHLVTAAKYAEYAVLASAVALLVRDARAIRRLTGTVAVWGLLAGVVALVQFVGLDIFAPWPSGDRQPSFVGIADLGTLGGAALAVAFVGILWPGASSRRVTVTAVVGGALSLVFSAGVAAELGLVGA